jgi:LuxR family maltose regulon positive regulatory protein
LLEMLAAEHARVIWIAAPPGYGKTTLLVQFSQAAAARGERTSWLTLDETDRHPTEFADHLREALAAFAPSLGERRSGDPDTLLIDALREAGSALTGSLCLDDCHLLVSEESLRLLGILLRRAPPSLRILAAARGQPAVPLAELELKGHARRLSAADLSFTEEEARAFLGEGVDEPTVEFLLRRTQGWPLALQLERGRSVTAQGPTLARYFSETMLNGLPASLREFLTDIAVLERINGDLANAARERSDSWTLLEEVEQRGLFLSVLDAQREWFQLHPLFREFLENHLHRTHARHEREIRRRAAKWLAGRQAWPEAIRQAMRSGDIELAARIVDETHHLEVMLRFGGSALGGLDQLPDEHLLRYPRLALCVAYAHFQEGRLLHARRLLDAMGVGEGTAAEAQRDVFEALIDMCEDKPGHERQERLESRLVRGEIEEPLMRGECYVVLMVDRLDQDDPADALRLSDRQLQETHNIDAPFLDGFGWMVRGIAHMARAELGAAEQCYEQCITISQRNFGRTSTHTPIAEILWAEALWERDRFAEAIGLLEAGLRRIDTIYGWYEVWEPAVMTAASVFARLDGLDRALAFLDEYQNSAQMRSLDRTVPLCEATRVSVLVHAGHVAEAGVAFERSTLPTVLRGSLEPRVLRVFTPSLLAAHDLSAARGDLGRWANEISTHIAYLKERGLKRRLLGMLLARAEIAEQLEGTTEACALFREALAIGASRGYVRIFLERARDLARTVAVVNAEPLDGNAQAEVRTMLASMRERGAPRTLSESTLLSPREAQVLSFMPQGLTSKEIALRLGVTENTVKGYRRTLFEKLGVTSRSQAIGKGRSLRLIH